MHWIYLIHKFHSLSWITEINELFHDILIYWDAPVYKGFRATYAPLQMTCISAGQCKPHTAAVTTAWLRSRRVQVLNWPACSPDLSPIENIWHIIKQKIHQRWTRTLQQLGTYIRQEWDQIPTPKLQKLITSMPRRLQTVLKRRCYTMVNMPPSQLFWDL